MTQECVFVGPRTDRAWGDGLFLAYPADALGDSPTMYWTDLTHRLLLGMECMVTRVRGRVVANYWVVLSYEEARDLLARRSQAPSRQLAAFDLLYDPVLPLVVGEDAGR